MSHDERGGRENRGQLVSSATEKGWLVLDLRRDFVETHTLVNEGAFDKYCFPWTPAKLGRRSAIFHHLSLFPPSLPEFDLTGIA